MIISVSTWSAHDLLLSGKLSPEGFLLKMKEFGAQGIEIVDFDFADHSMDSIKNIKRLTDKHNMLITCMSIEHDLCQLTEEARQQDVDKVVEWMEISKAIGVRNVRVFTGWNKEGVPYEQQMEWVYEGLSKLYAKAEEMDLDLVLENHDDVCLKADEILAMRERVGSKYFYTCPDIFNYKKFAGKNIPVIDEESFSEIDKLLPIAKNAHIKICEAVNNNTEDKYLDVGRMVDMLKAVGYDGALALEFMWPYMSEDKDQIEEIGKAIQVMKHHCK